MRAQSKIESDRVAGYLASGAKKATSLLVVRRRWRPRLLCLLNVLLNKLARAGQDQFDVRICQKTGMRSAKPRATRNAEA